MTRIGPRPNNTHCREMDRALKRNPPVIIWEKGKHGVMVAVEIRDPHAESSVAAQAERMRATADRADRKAAAEEAEQARLRALELLQREADDTAERFTTYRTQNTSLLNAARTI